MPKIYYVDSSVGSDLNNGLSADRPLASASAVEALKLAAGDTILFARSTSYNDELILKYSGNAANPITIGAYGEGEPPLFYGHERGIYGSKTSFITVRDIAIADTAGNAIYAGNAKNWIVDNVIVHDTGSARAGSISFQSSINITIKNSTIFDVKGDGIWIDNVTGVSIENNKIGTVQGQNSDNVQVVNSKDVIVRGNSLDMTGDTDSSKGNLVVNKSQNVLIEGNTLSGGGFGASINSDNVAIVGNEISGQEGYSWSFAIGLGEKWNVSNYLISDNYIHDVKFGVAITGIGAIPVTRTDIEVINNVFDAISGAALKVDRPASGEFSGNAIGVGITGAAVSEKVAALGTWELGLNTTFNTIDPNAVGDTADIEANGDTASGNVLANDTSLTNATLNLVKVNGQAVNHDTLVDGNYGHLVISADGSYQYEVDADKMKGIDNDVVDVFSYLVTDKSKNALADLTINVAARPNDAPTLVADLLAAQQNGTASGNVLANDRDTNGDVLKLTGVNGVSLGSTPLKIAGVFGTLTVDVDGSYSYAADVSKVGLLAGAAKENFTYSATDGRATTSSTLSFALDQMKAPLLLTKVKPTAVNDKFEVGSDGIVLGNILANDYDLNGQQVYLRTIGNERIKDGEPTLIGKYGILHIKANGDFVYETDQTKLSANMGVVSESFQYKISDGSLQDTGGLGILIDTHLLNASHALVA